MTRRATRVQPVEEEVQTGVGFGIPPEPKRLKYDWVKIAKRCKRRPGDWLLVFEQDKETYATAIRQGGIAALTKDKGFELRTANNRQSARPRVCDLWVRYVPENDTTTKEKK